MNFGGSVNDENFDKVNIFTVKRTSLHHKYIANVPQGWQKISFFQIGLALKLLWQNVVIVQYEQHVQGLKLIKSIAIYYSTMIINCVL